MLPTPQPPAFYRCLLGRNFLTVSSSARWRAATEGPATGPAWTGGGPSAEDRRMDPNTPERRRPPKRPNTNSRRPIARHARRAGRSCPLQRHAAAAIAAEARGCVGERRVGDRAVLREPPAARLVARPALCAQQRRAVPSGGELKPSREGRLAGDGGVLARQPQASGGVVLEDLARTSRGTCHGRVHGRSPCAVL